MQGGVKTALLKSFTTMGRSKKTETAKAEEAVVVDVQVGEEAAPSEPISEQEAQPSNEIEEVEETPEAPKEEKAPAKGKKTSSVSEPEEEISSRDAELMRLYPQYEKIWITPKGFVHPEGTPDYLLKGAKLFKNKFFNNKK